MYFLESNSICDQIRLVFHFDALDWASAAKRRQRRGSSGLGSEMLPPRVHHYAVRCIVAIPIAILLALLIANIGIICRKENQAILYARWLPKSAGTPEQVVGSHTWKASHSPSPQRETVDEHPVGQLMKGADQQWKQYDMERSKTFKATVETYRRKYGRHPPPGFKQVHILAFMLVQSVNYVNF